MDRIVFKLQKSIRSENGWDLIFFPAIASNPEVESLVDTVFIVLSDISVSLFSVIGLSNLN